MNKFLSFFVSFVVMSVLIGCGDSNQSKPVAATYVDADAQQAAKEGKAVEDPSKVGPKSSSEGNPSLDKLTKAQDAAAGKFAKNPKDSKLKHAFVVATVRLATATMAADELDPKVKYRRALRLYREALKHEPNNEEAKNNSQQIIDVYKSMGKEVPTE